MNSTNDFYRFKPVDLLFEHTICESFARTDSPYMAALECPLPYGEIVGNLLDAEGLLRQGMKICEIGGGYGNLMQGFLSRYGDRVGHVTMADLSLNLLTRQRRVLDAWKEKISFIRGSAQELVPALHRMDLFIMNEVAGDLDTWIFLDTEELPEEVEERVGRYGLTIPAGEKYFHFNMGAVRTIEEICRTKACAFISEHSSDPIIPAGMEYLARDLTLDGYPREIRLKDHSEYTIRFEHLIKATRWWGREVLYGSMIDLVGLQRSPRMRSIFIGRLVGSEQQEIIYELLDHIREYRWMLIL